LVLPPFAFLPLLPFAFLPLLDGDGDGVGNGDLGVFVRGAPGDLGVLGEETAEGLSSVAPISSNIWAFS